MYRQENTVTTTDFEGSDPPVGRPFSGLFLEAASLSKSTDGIRTDANRLRAK
jgi:hypothetical protein